MKQEDVKPSQKKESSANDALPKAPPIAGSTKDRIEEIVRRHFRELPEEEACGFRPEDYELPDEEETKSPE